MTCQDTANISIGSIKCQLRQGHDGKHTAETDEWVFDWDEKGVGGTLKETYDLYDIHDKEAVQ